MACHNCQEQLLLPSPLPEGQGPCAFHNSKGCRIDYISVQGEEVDFEVTPSEIEYLDVYTFRIPECVKTGDKLNVTCVTHHDQAGIPPGEPRNYWEDHSPSDSTAFVYVLFFRISERIKLVRVEPDPDMIRTNGTTTMTWRRYLPPGERSRCEVVHERE